MGEEFDFEKLNRAYRDEKGKAELQKIDRDFYAQLSKYLQRLSAQKSESEKKNGAEAAGTVMLRDEHRRATQRAESLVDLRLKKIMDIARLDVHGVKSDTKNAIPDESAVMGRLASVLREWCAGALGDGLGDARIDEVAVPEEKRTPDKIDAKEGGIPAVRESVPVPMREERVVVAVLADIPPFAGLDRNYELKRGDVATLPANIGEILCKSKKVRKIL
jgi:DNA replication initiation complex subunit (GINS family)